MKETRMARRSAPGFARLPALVLLLLAAPTVEAQLRPARASRGMVVAEQPLAARVGAKILADGGNAVDAAVATAMALAVVYPQAGNLGGGGFLVLARPDGSSTTIDFRERAPKAATRDMYLDERGEVVRERSTVGPLSVGVPGSPAGLHLAQQKFGSMPWKDLLRPAIRLARDGFPVDPFLEDDLALHAPTLLRFESSRAIFLRDGAAWRQGEILRQPDLAKTLELLAEEGPVAFYKGRIARQIAGEMERQGGLISLADLADYRAVLREPIRGTYRGHDVIGMGPPSSGGVAVVQLLNILEGFDLRSLGHGSAEAIHVWAEALKRVFADRAHFLGDPDHVDVPVEGLVSKEYAETLRGSIQPDRAVPSTEIGHGDPSPHESGQTTHLSVVDRSGMAVSLTTTLNSSFGSQVVVRGAGFFLNNEMDDFVAKPGAPNLYGLVGEVANAIAPGKRMLSSMSPTIVRDRSGRIVLVVGSPGGPRIISTTAQVVSFVLDHRMDVGQAVAAPRIHHQWLPDVLFVEPLAISPDTARLVEKKGHRIERTGYMGSAQAIQVGEGGLLYGASDPRRGGAAVGVDK